MKEDLTCRSRDEYLAFADHPDSAVRLGLELALLREITASAKYEPIGHCRACAHAAKFMVSTDRKASRIDGVLPVNLRESLVCRACGLSNRQRLVAGELRAFVREATTTVVYAMEQVTPFYRWLQHLGPGISSIGSEYLGPGFAGGSTHRGIRHEDATQLSLATASADVVVSNDVLEHVPDPRAVLREAHRILRPGGIALWTFPFLADQQATRVRARVRPDGGIEHVLPPSFHANPVAREGSLVYHEFGWDVLDRMREAGFEDVGVRVAWSFTGMHVGGPQLLHVARKG